MSTLWELLQKLDIENTKDCVMHSEGPFSCLIHNAGIGPDSLARFLPLRSSHSDNVGLPDLP